MQRILYFDICTLIIIVILLFSIFFHKMIQGLVNRIFLLLAFTCLGATVLDLLRASDIIIQGNYIVREMVTYGYFIFRCLNAFIYILYVIGLTDTWQKVEHNLRVKTIIAIPNIVFAISLIVNMFTGAIFYFNEQNEYVRGEYMYVIHICLLFYVAYGIYYVWKYRVLFSLGKLLGVFSMFPLTCIAVLIQFLFPALLVEMFATVLAILILIITVQRPDENMNPYFGIRNYQAYWNDLRRAFYNEKRMDILYIHIMNYNALISTLGEEAAREMLQKTIAPIMTLRKKHKVRADLYYLNHGCLAIFLNAEGHERTDAFAKDISDVIKNDKSIRKSGLSLNARICIVHCQEDVDNFKAASIIYNVLKNQTNLKGDIIYAADIMGQSGFEIKGNIDGIINEALEKNRFELYYQPIYSTKQKRFHSAEVLIRLYDEKYGYISPDLFIPAAEKSGAIYQIGIFVFEETCRFIKSDAFEALGLEYIEINLSVAQCMQDNLANDLLDILHKYEVSPERINLEITETAMENSYDVMMKNLNTLAKEGITFSLDDYGTGFSNIQRVITMPLSIVKLDKSFIDEINNPDYRAIVINTIRMLKDLNLKILSEGVEQEGQLGFLSEQECDYIQGYYFSKPLPREEFVEFMRGQAGL
ncbi:MAG: EAL domain-containing protein [Lachnospiraceae bacterium]|nr:EAL domain-containing protein [Lachnospiraceae bacterium]